MGNHYVNCRQCGRHNSEAGYISSRGMCNQCANENFLTATANMVCKSGPVWNLYKKRWAEGMIAAVQDKLANGWPDE